MVLTDCTTAAACQLHSPQQGDLLTGSASNNLDVLLLMHDKLHSPSLA